MNSEMIIASLSKVWHLVPIVIAIILLKKFINNKDKKEKMLKNQENEKNGLTLQLRTIKKYEALGYKISSHEKQKIDLVLSKNEKILLIKFNTTSESKSVKDEDIKTFYNDANEYIKENEIKEKVEFRYVIAYMDVLHKSAIKILTDNTYNCKYVVC